MKIIKEHLLLLLIIFLGIIPLLDLFHPGLPLTHDGQDHVARIANFYQSLSEGNIVPRWAGNLNWGYGHPILMFLYPLPSYISSLFHVLGFSLIDSVKLVYGLTYILSGIAMYLWVKEFLSREAGFVAAILYMFAPYRFVELYVRGDIGEHVAFVFPPLVLYFLIKIYKLKPDRYFDIKNYPYFTGISFSMVGLILAHNAVTVMFLPIIAGYVLYLFYISKNKYLFAQSIAALFFGFILSSFFLLPAYFEGKYTLRDIVTDLVYTSRFVNFKDLLYGDWSYGITGQFSVQIGLLQILSVLLSPLLIVKFFKKNRRLAALCLLFLVVFVISTFLMFRESDIIWETVTILQKFQFPWRFLYVTIFSTAVLGGFVFYYISKRKFSKYFLLIFIILILLINRNYWHAKSFLYKPDNFFEGIYDGTTDTGESSPIWSVRFMEARSSFRIKVISGEAKISEKSRNSTEHKYQIDSISLSRIRENTLYFPGWAVIVNGREIPVQFQDPLNRGVITFNLEKGLNNVSIKFEDTKLRKFANVLSVSSFLIIITYGLIFLITSRKEQKLNLR
ncbi:MAG: hypothetical protein A2857_05280 [Candidatus Levybacteria bacterium RIFCSPHIGHO2_01_FULL_36_15]|nr:MAG: hypothetical protein A2857_05280 [Candidatus Levybacteria bacterium RIFCSPHIGHO2_01_FULL_36_15]